jgi:WD40 repeat protein
LDRPGRPLINEAVVALSTALQAPYYTTKILRGHAMGIKWAAFSPDGRTIVTASADHTTRLWDAATGKATAVLRGHEDFVTFAAFSPDGKTVVTASTDHIARLWRTETLSLNALIIEACRRLAQIDQASERCQSVALAGSD